MPSFKPVSRDELPASNTREGKVSTGLIRGFIDSGTELAEVELDEGNKSIQSTRSTLQNYVTRHKLPVRVFTMGGKLYIERVASNGAANVEVDAEAEGATV